MEEQRGNPVLLYAGAIHDSSVRVLYECLRRRGRCEQLDLVLSTAGGSITTTRQVALLLREFTRRLTIIVPYRAWSAGTLLCLSGDELVLGPMAQLGPIDSHLAAAAEPPPGAPGMVSAEDIRTFRQMAEDWFGVCREEDRLQVLALVAQRIFPATLASFYRFDYMVRQIAHELLRFQLPEEAEEVRQRIVDQLVSGYHAHDFVLSRVDVRDLGLRVSFASEKEEEQMWSLSQRCRGETPEHPGAGQGEEVVGIVASGGFFAREVHRWSGPPGGQGSGTDWSGAVPQSRWEIDQ
ncbi:MAG TPA: hypothetical protein VFB84_19785 [Micromonosporaceae bacterium]|nr:hypothetical protein [Micromonosporaceae bacterium]